MENNTRKTKVFRDPVHGLITFDKEKEQVLLDLIDTPEFQRLRRIRQLGVAYVAYHGAVHTRFGHSLGVCHLAGLYMDQLYDYYKDNLFKSPDEFEEKRKLVRCAALLHDIGHGPFSHVFESAIKDINSDYNLSHEGWTAKIITDENTEVYQKLTKNGINPTDIIKIFDKTYDDDQLLSKIVASQFDADRMDYMQRDSIFTGVKYGLIDQEWLLHSLRQDNTERGKIIAVDASKGQNSIVNFILARKNLFQQVYFHHRIRAAEIHLKKILLLIGDLLINHKNVNFSKDVENFFKTDPVKLSVGQYLKLDDFVLITEFKNIAASNNNISLKRLCNNFVNGNIFKNEKIFKQKKLMKMNLEEQLNSNCLIENSFSETSEYFYDIDETNKTFYENNYTKGEKKSEEDNENKEARNEIWILDEDNRRQELSSASDEIKAIMQSPKNKTGEYHLCFDSEIFDRKEVIKIIR